MKKYITILFCLLSIYTNATTYYVATDGDNGNAGTIGSPWLTWTYGMEQLSAGDTLFIRGGVYNATGNIYIHDGNTNDGTLGNPIVVMAYPADWTAGNFPIYDCSGFVNGSGFIINYKDYWTFQGLTIRDIVDAGTVKVGTTPNDYNNLTAFKLWTCNQIHLINCIAHDINGQGFKIEQCDTVYVRACDSYNNYDALNWGGKADGFQINYTLDANFTNRIYFDKCRAWNNSDDGWDFLNNGVSVIDSCWAWANGYDRDGSGQGMKAGLLSSDPISEQYIFTNNVATYNSHGGFRDNCNGRIAHIDARWYNNTSFANGGYGFSSSVGTGDMNTNIVRNNIFYADTTGPYYAEYVGLTTHDHNSFDITDLTLIDADFISIDSTGISAARQSDGLLPNNDCYNYFLHLSSVSQAINQGIDVGLTYDGIAPDLGAFEYEAQDPPTLATLSTYDPYWTSPTTASTGGYVSDDGGDPGGITQKGVCWNTTGTPTTADSKTEEGTGDGAFTSTMTGLTQGTTYYVRAYAINSVGTAYGTQMTFRTQIIKHLNKIIKHLGKFMIIN